jgi:hypothetical protein
MLRVDDGPFAVLELATGTGAISRRLDESELKMIAGPAFEAACAVIEENVAATTSKQFLAVCDLLFADPVCMIRAVVDDVASLRHCSLTLLTFCIETMHSIRSLPRGTIEDDLLRSFWVSAPVLAAAMELSEDITPDRAARCEEFLGWAPEEGPEAISTGAAVDRVMAGIDAEQLEAIQRFVELVPRCMLSLDALVAADFEWLMAEKRRTAEPLRWWLGARSLIDGLEPFTEQIARHLEARLPPQGCPEWAALPQATLAAAIHVARASSDGVTAIRALREAAVFAPRLVIHDLVLAAALVWTEPDTGRETWLI